MTAWWCEYAWLGGDQVTAGVVLTVEAGRFVKITSGASAPPLGSERLDGLTIPGMANAHSHAFHRALRGRTQVGTGSFWTWRDQMYTVANRLDPDRYLTLARATYAEMALAGITAVGEFHYLHHAPAGTPYDDANAMGHALIAAAGDAGIRISLLDTCYLQGGIGVELTDTQRRFSDGDALSWATRVSDLADSLGSMPAAGSAALDDAVRAQPPVSPSEVSQPPADAPPADAPPAPETLASRPMPVPQVSAPMARVGAAVHSVRAVDPAAMEIVRAWADSRGAPLHAHVSEQPAENERCLAAYGVTPTGLLAERGLLGERFTSVHATHLTDADVDLHGSRGCFCCFCPTTERDLADGIGPARALVDTGARLTLGTDSHAVIDLFEEARAVELDERLASQVRGNHPAASLLQMATIDGYASLGWPDAGRLETGAIADFVTVSLDSVRLAGMTPAHALESLIFAGTAGDVRHVVVGGRPIVRDGVHLSIDVVAELRRSIADAFGETS